MPAWVELEEEEEPVGFLDDDAGVAIFMDIFHRSVLPLVNAVMTRALTADSNSVSRSTPSDRIKTLGRERFLLWEVLKMEKARKRRAPLITKRTRLPPNPKTPLFPNAKTEAVRLKTFTQYKRVDRKVKPVDDVPSDGTVPEGDPDWKKKRMAEAEEKMRHGHHFDPYSLPRFSSIEPGSRLTEARLQEILERVSKTLTPKELELFTHILKNREQALAWDFTECGRIRSEVMPPQRIKTVPHKAWQTKHIPIPKPLIPKVIQLLKDRVLRGVIEESHAAYRNNWFLVQKKDGGLRLINDAQKMNGVTLRDAFSPPGAEEFSEEFGGCLFISLLDLFSGYDHVELDPLSRDMTTFSTPIGLFRMCTLPQGATNSVAQFMRAVVRMLYDLIPHKCRPFLDDICVKGPRYNYGGEEVEPGLRRYVVEHLVNIDAVLVNCELAGATVAPVKSQWIQEQAVLLGYLCTPEGRAPDQAKVIKVNEWRTCSTPRDIRSFVGLTGYYRIWIRDYGMLAAPLYALMKKDAEWEWTENQQTVMEILQRKITTAPILAVMVFDDPRYTDIFVMVDASLEGWGGVIEQTGPDEKRHPCRFESGVWNNAEKRYDATKRELRGLLNMLKRTRHYLYGTHFTIETDALVLKHQLNGAASDVPGALLMRWIAWILNFDFTVKHIPGSKNCVADALSRKPAGPSDLMEKDREQDIDDFVDAQIFAQSARASSRKAEKKPHLQGEWSKESHEIAAYLEEFVVPAEIAAKSPSKIRKWKASCYKYFVKHGNLWTRPNRKGALPRKVVDDPKLRRELWEKVHKASGHRGREATYDRITKYYYWRGMYAEVENWVRSCPDCQAFSPKRFEDEPEHSIPSPWPFAKWTLDIQNVASSAGARTKYFVVEARDDLTGYPEATIVTSTKSAPVAAFVRKQILLRWGWPMVVLVDGGSEFEGDLVALLENLGIKRVVISPYNSRANGLNERGHFSIASALAKLCKGKTVGWQKWLPYVLHADRTSVRESHGKTSFFLAHGFNPTSEFEVDHPSWRLMEWEAFEAYRSEEGMSDADLRAALLLERAKCLQASQFDRAIAADTVGEARKKWAEQRKKRFAHKLRPEVGKISVGDLVLVWDSLREIDMSSWRKLTYRWDGPYRVKNIGAKGTYVLETLDGVELEPTYSSRRVKKFFKYNGVWLEVDDDPLLDPDDPNPDHHTPALLSSDYIELPNLEEDFVDYPDEEANNEEKSKESNKEPLEV